MISDPKQLHSINNRVHIALCRDKGYVELKLPEAVFLVQEIMRLNDELTEARETRTAPSPEPPPPGMTDEELESWCRNSMAGAWQKVWGAMEGAGLRCKDNESCLEAALRFVGEQNKPKDPYQVNEESRPPREPNWGGETVKEGVP